MYNKFEEFQTLCVGSLYLTKKVSEDYESSRIHQQLRKKSKSLYPTEVSQHTDLIIEDLSDPKRVCLTVTF